jgi:hypothetical protein
VKKIKLTKGQFALVDDEDFEWLNQWKWSANWAEECNTFYVRRAVGGKSIWMHRLLAKPKKWQQVDHKDHSGLNNQKLNLRSCSFRNNQWNSRKQRFALTSKYKGVCWKKQKRKWETKISAGRIRENGMAMTLYIGLFDDEVVAAKAYDAAARKYFGEFACVNFPRKNEACAIAS